MKTSTSTSRITSTPTKKQSITWQQRIMTTKKWRINKCNILKIQVSQKIKIKLLLKIWFWSHIHKNKIETIFISYQKLTIKLQKYITLNRCANNWFDYFIVSWIFTKSTKLCFLRLYCLGSFKIYWRSFDHSWSLKLLFSSILKKEKKNGVEPLDLSRFRIWKDRPSHEKDLNLVLNLFCQK